MPNRKFHKNNKKITKKIQKIKKIPLWLHFRPKFVEKGRERGKIKIIVPFHSFLTRNRNSKRIAKKFKKLKNTITASFQAKIGWKGLRKRGIKIVVPFRSYTTG